MNEGDAIDLVQSAIWMVVVGAGPCVGAAMAVGVVIALLQALTQVQEMTLTFLISRRATSASPAYSRTAPPCPRKWSSASPRPTA